MFKCEVGSSARGGVGWRRLGGRGGGWGRERGTLTHTSKGGNRSEDDGGRALFYSVEIQAARLTWAWNNTRHTNSKYWYKNSGCKPSKILHKIQLVPHGGTHITLPKPATTRMDTQPHTHTHMRAHTPRDM